MDYPGHIQLTGHFNEETERVNCKKIALSALNRQGYCKTFAKLFATLCNSK